MKASDILVMMRAAEPAGPRLMRKDAAGLYVGAPELLEMMKAAGWIKPTVGRNRMTLFDQKKLDACIDRLNDGEFPGELESAVA